MATPEVKCPDCGARNRVPIVSSGRARCGKCHTDLPWLVDAGAEEMQRALAVSSLPILVDLWAPWCGPCKLIAPALEQISAERAGALRILKVNVDEWPTVSAQLGVQGIPTMVLFAGGVEVGRQVGALPVDRIRAWVDATLATGRTG